MIPLVVVFRTNTPPDCSLAFNVITTLGMREFAFSRSKIHWFSLRDFLQALLVEKLHPHAHLDVPRSLLSLFLAKIKSRLRRPRPRRACVRAPAAPAGPSRAPSLPGLPRAAAPGSGLASADAVSERSSLAGGGGRAGRRSPKGGASRAGRGAAMAGSQDMFDAIVMADERWVVGPGQRLPSAAEAARAW